MSERKGHLIPPMDPVSSPEKTPNPRVFSLKEAAQLIPKLEELFETLLAKKRMMQKKHDELLVLDLIAGEKIYDYNTAEGKDYLQKSSELEDLILSFEEDIVRFNELGCFLRDLDKGIVDFFYVHGKELVYLSWRRGEKKIAFYHDLADGYRKRKLL